MNCRTLLSVTLALAGLAWAMQPLESDFVVLDGEETFREGIWSTEFVVPAGRCCAGFYLQVERVERFAVRLNGSEVRVVESGKTPRTMIRTEDLSDHARLLKAGANRLELVALEGAGRFRVRAWVSELAWYISSLHAHTTYSDGVLSVHELLQEVLADGGRAYAITDHDTLGQCYDTAFHPVGNLQPIRGYEWTTDSGHANVLGCRGIQTHPHGSIHQFIDDATYCGGLVQINHPCDLANMAWARCPVLDPGIDMIEVFNSVTWFPADGTDSDAEAVAWWHELLAAGNTIAGVGNADFHWFAPEVDVLKSCTLVRAASNEPDSILTQAKLGTGMIMDAPDDSRLWLYADTNSNGSWDIVMGEHFRVPSGSRTVRFRLEVEDADWFDEVRALDRSGEFYSHTLWTGGDHSYEWSRTFGPSDRNFYRVELLAEFGLEYEQCTNPVYVNHPDYERGPTEFNTVALDWPDTLYVGRDDTLHVVLRNTAGYSPYRFGLQVACDTALFDITGWQTSGNGVGEARNGIVAGHEMVEWRGGYDWQNRLAVGTNFDYWLTVSPKQTGEHPVLYRSWADDRLFVVEEDPASGHIGPDGRFWYRRLVPVDELTGVAEPPKPTQTRLMGSVPGIVTGPLVLRLEVAPSEPVLGVEVIDATGRSRRRLAGELGPGRQLLTWLGDDDHGRRLAAGVYFIRVRTGVGNRVRRLLLAD
ncbi:CehA/McbA family metallohydrolase [candidate division WOR-3 bacterium]|nr:CehA/McbA family metallohydrolase [candidate division WOR-3 bacterium]